MTDKQRINNMLKELERFGIKVYNFSFHRQMPKGAVGVPDHMLIGRKKVYFVEDKLSKSDRLREAQLEFAETVSKCESGDVVYFINDDNGIDSIIDTIITLEGGTIQ